ncbi:hypothetical protein L9F63_000064, partial [Diploptera punctata]
VTTCTWGMWRPWLCLLFSIITVTAHFSFQNRDLILLIPIEFNGRFFTISFSVIDLGYYLLL